VPPGSLDDLLSRADSLIECGEALLEQNRLTEAESAFNQALELYQQALQQAAQNQDLVDQAQAWQGIGKTLLLLERLEEAKQALDAALGLYRQLSIRGEPLIKLLITAIEAERKSGHFELIPDLALEAINEAKALPKEEQVIMLQLLEKKFTRLNLLEWAERCLTRN
jgi:tetratricopeptide (TPR) repeat protein